MELNTEYSVAVRTSRVNRSTHETPLNLRADVRQCKSTPEWHHLASPRLHTRYRSNTRPWRDSLTAASQPFKAGYKGKVRSTRYPDESRTSQFFINVSKLQPESVPGPLRTRSPSIGATRMSSLLLGNFMGAAKDIDSLTIPQSTEHILTAERLELGC